MTGRNFSQPGAHLKVHLCTHVRKFQHRNVKQNIFQTYDQRRDLRIESTIVTEGGSKIADGDVGKVGGGEVVVAAAGAGGPAAPVQLALAAVKGVLVVVIVPVMHGVGLGKVK